MAKRLKTNRGGPTPNYAVRNMLRNFDAKNTAERSDVPWEKVERQVREQVQRDYADLSPSEVEDRVERRMARGHRSYRPAA